MRIALLGNFGTRNFGNDASLEAMLDALRRLAPAAELICICPRPEVVRARYGVETIGLTVESAPGSLAKTLERLSFGTTRRLRSLSAAFWRCRGVDVVIVPGTGILDDYRDRPRGWPFMLLRWCVAARLWGARLAFVSIGAGPILNPTSRRFMKWAAKLCGYRSYRDAPSLEFMRSLGIDVTQDPVFPDLAFRLPVDAPPAREAAEAAPVTIGLGVMTYLGWIVGPRDGEIYASYLERLTHLTAALGERGYRVRLLMGDASDAQVAEALRARLDAPSQVSAWLVSDTATDMHDVIRQIADCDVVVAVRYHNVVAALMQRRPTISLEYADKNSAVLRAFGLGEFCHHIERFEVDAVLADVERLVSARAEHAARIGRASVEARAALDRQDRILAEQVLRLPLRAGAEIAPIEPRAQGARGSAGTRASRS